MGAISGWGGSLVISDTAEDTFNSGTRLPVLAWNIKNSAEPLDVTMMGQRGYEDCISGITVYDLSFDCLYDTTLNPFHPQVDLNPGEIGPFPAASNSYYTVTFSMDKSVIDPDASRAWYFPRVILIDVNVVDEVRGLVKYSVTAKSTRSGIYAFSTGVNRGAVPRKPSRSPG